MSDVLEKLATFNHPVWSLVARKCFSDEQCGPWAPCIFMHSLWIFGVRYIYTVYVSSKPQRRSSGEELSCSVIQRVVSQIPDGQNIKHQVKRQPTTVGSDCDVTIADRMPIEIIIWGITKQKKCTLAIRVCESIMYCH